MISVELTASIGVDTGFTIASIQAIPERRRLAKWSPVVNITLDVHTDWGGR